MDTNLIGRIRIENAQRKEFEELINLNQSNLPHVSSISLSDLGDFYNQAVYFRVAKIDNCIAGFLLAFGANAKYLSPNYLWFKDQYRSFIYIDRVIITPKMRRKGIATILYNDLEIFAKRKKVPLIACEYNIVPKNEISRLFHKKYGFREVGVQNIQEVSKVVSLQIKHVERATKK